MFKFPKIPGRLGLEDEKCIQGIPKFNWGDLLEKDQIGMGGFGTVFTAIFKGKTVVVK